MFTATLLALLLLGIPVALVIVAGLVLLIASRRTRVAGLVILAIVGVLFLIPALLGWLWLSYPEHHVATPAAPVAIDSPDWISMEEEIAPVAATDEDVFTSSVSDADTDTAETAGEPTDVEAVETSVVEPMGETADAAESDAEMAESESVSGSTSPTQAISRALLRAVGDSSAPATETAVDLESETAETPDETPDEFVDEVAENRETTNEVASTPVAIESTDAVADSRSADADPADVAEIERYLERAASARAGMSDVDILVPGASSLSQPPWVDKASFEIDGIVYRPVASGPFATRDECRRALSDAMKRAVDEYVNEYHGQPEAAKYVDVDVAYIKKHVRRGDVYQQPFQASFGPMIQQHALLEFGDDFRHEIERRWNQAKVTSRLARVSLAAAAVLAGLATIFVYLRVDAATRGYYSGRLQIAAGAVILGLVALGILTARWIPWL